MTNIIDASNRFIKKSVETEYASADNFGMGAAFLAMDINTQLDVIKQQNLAYISQGQVGEKGEAFNLDVLITMAMMIFGPVCLPFGGQQVKVMVPENKPGGNYVLFIARIDPMNLAKMVDAKKPISECSDFQIVIEYSEMSDSEEELRYTEQAREDWLFGERSFNFSEDSMIDKASVETIICQMEKLANNAGRHGRLAYHSDIGGRQLFSMAIKRSPTIMTVIELTIANC